MDLNRDAMLVALHIAAWSGRLYDCQASDHVAVAHEASTGAGRYNKRLLPKAALAALNATMSEARTQHDAQSLPWDDKGSRLLTVANYEQYTGIMDGLRERLAWDEAMHQALSIARAEGKAPGGVEETVRNAHAS